ncbi:MAG: hypothetical protein N2A42_11050 [Luteolibacter sp.]
MDQLYTSRTLHRYRQLLLKSQYFVKVKHLNEQRSILAAKSSASYP